MIDRKVSIHCPVCHGRGLNAKCKVCQGSGKNPEFYLSLPETPDVVGGACYSETARATPADHSSYALQMLVAAGHIPQAKVDEALAIAAKIPGVGDAQSVRDAWQPIETAPKDAEVWVFNGEQGRMKWYENSEFAGWLWVDDLISDVDPDPEPPSHWMPMPAPPQKPVDKVKP